MAVKRMVAYTVQKNGIKLVYYNDEKVKREKLIPLPPSGALDEVGIEAYAYLSMAGLRAGLYDESYDVYTIEAYARAQQEIVKIDKIIDDEGYIHEYENGLVGLNPLFKARESFVKEREKYAKELGYLTGSSRRKGDMDEARVKKIVEGLVAQGGEGSKSSKMDAERIERMERKKLERENGIAHIGKGVI